MVTIDGENVWESGYIVYRLMGLVPDCPNVETIPSNDSVYWSHFAEGTLMSYLQNRTVVDITSEAWTGGAMGNLGEEGKDGVKQYAEWLKVRRLHWGRWSWLMHFTVVLLLTRRSNQSRSRESALSSL